MHTYHLQQHGFGTLYGVLLPGPSTTAISLGLQHPSMETLVPASEAVMIKEATFLHRCVSETFSSFKDSAPSQGVRRVSPCRALVPEECAGRMSHSTRRSVPTAPTTISLIAELLILRQASAALSGCSLNVEPGLRTPSMDTPLIIQTKGHITYS